jgi:SH3-like domain-containing protein
MHPSLVLAFVLLTALALAPVSYVAFAPGDAVQVYVGPSHGGPSAGTTPNNDPRQASLIPPASAAQPEAPAAKPAVEPTSPTVALDPVALRAEPEPADLIARKIEEIEPAATPMPDFLAADTALYAKGNARLRAAPSTSAAVLRQLAADAPLRATARSRDGAWWRVSLAGGRSGYVHQAAVSQVRMARSQPRTTPASAPVATTAARPAAAQPEWQRRGQDLFGYLDRSMSWLADQAGGGPAPKVIRSER